MICYVVLDSYTVPYRTIRSSFVNEWMNENACMGLHTTILGTRIGRVRACMRFKETKQNNDCDGMCDIR